MPSSQPLNWTPWRNADEMDMHNEVQDGLELVKRIFHRGAGFYISDIFPIPDRRVYGITVSTFPHHRNDVSFELSEEFLSDLPNTPKYESELDAYASALVVRIENVSPRYFYCKSGKPLEIEIEWPFAPCMVKMALLGQPVVFASECAI